jgi:hypothetical protein
MVQTNPGLPSGTSTQQRVRAPVGRNLPPLLQGVAKYEVRARPIASIRVLASSPQPQMQAQRTMRVNRGRNVVIVLVLSHYEKSESISGAQTCCCVGFLSRAWYVFSLVFQPKHLVLNGNSRYAKLRWI